MDRNLALEFVRITEAAAIASARFTGLGDEKKADQAAVDAMRRAFDKTNVDGVVVIGEGERDEAPMLYIGEEVGLRGEGAPKIDIALDPLEGTTICAHGGVGALSVIAVAERGKFLHAPDTYMDKICCGPKARGKISLDKSAKENVQIVADCLKKSVEEVTVMILDRERHQGIIEEVRSVGARIRLIGDGDVAAGVATCLDESGVDLMIGTGGAPEGVITAAAVKCLGGDFQGRLNFRNEEEKQRAKKMGVSDINKCFGRDELAQGDVVFCATGVTDGPFLKGVRTLSRHRGKTESVVMRSKTETIRFIEAQHNFELKKV